MNYYLLRIEPIEKSDRLFSVLVQKLSKKKEKNNHNLAHYHCH